jgi:hypothetical protein
MDMIFFINSNKKKLYFVFIMRHDFSDKAKILENLSLLQNTSKIT